MVVPASPEVQAWQHRDQAQTAVVVELGQGLTRTLERFFLDQVLPRTRDGQLDRDHWRTCREQLALVLEQWHGLTARLPYPGGDDGPW